MSQTRRSFLTRLASGLVGLSLVDVEWIPTPILRHLREVPAPTGINDITAWVLRLLADELHGYRAQFVPGDYRVDGHTSFNHQFHVGMHLSDEEASRGVFVEQYLQPVAAALAREVFARLPTHFGGLPLPRDVADGALAKDNVTGIAVRGIRVYDIGSESPPGWQYRFDILAKTA